MREELLILYINELLYQARVARFAAEQYDIFYSQKEDDYILKSFSASQSFLTAAAQISKMLWSNGNSKKGEKLEEKRLREFRVLRSETLLQLFDIDKIITLKNRDVRNAIEHFDERMDAFLIDAKENIVYADKIITSKNLFVVNNNEPIFLRRINPKTKEVSVLNEVTNMSALSGAIQYIDERLGELRIT